MGSSHLRSQLAALVHAAKHPVAMRPASCYGMCQYTQALKGQSSPVVAAAEKGAPAASSRGGTEAKFAPELPAEAFGL